jgi:hypothetical protein
VRPRLRLEQCSKGTLGPGARTEGTHPTPGRVLRAGAMRRAGGSGLEVVYGYLQIYCPVFVCWRRMQTPALQGVIVMLRDAVAFLEEMFRGLGEMVWCDCLNEF